MSEVTADKTRLAAISRKVLFRTIIVAAIIALGVVGMQVLQATMDLQFTKTPMPLKQPLPFLSKEFGGVPARYRAVSYDSVMNEETLEVLGTRDYLLRSYTDTHQKEGQPTALLSLNLNYYASGDANPHVPEYCWAGAGKIERQSSRRIFEIPNVVRADGSVVTLRARIISFLPEGESENPDKLRNVVYLFNVNGEYVATPREVTSLFWKATNAYAFDTKIEVTVGNDKEYCSQEQAIAAVSDFLRAGLAKIEECLPDLPGRPGPAAMKAGGATDLYKNK